METRNGKAAAETAAQVKAQADKTLDTILAELTPVVKSAFPKANGRVERAVELIRSGAVLELKPIDYETGHQVFIVKRRGGNDGQVTSRA